MLNLTARFDEINRAWTSQRWNDWQATCAEAYLFEPFTGWRLDLVHTMAWNRAVFAAYPDYQETVIRLHTTNEAVIAEVSATGTHAVDFVLPGQPPLRATGRPFTVSYAKVLAFDKHGLVVHDRQYLDRLDLFTQLDVLGRERA